MIDFTVVAVLSVAILVFVALVGHDTWWGKALREWQTGLGAVLGLICVGLSVQLQSEETRKIRAFEADTEARELTAVLYLEVKEIGLEAAAIASTAEIYAVSESGNVGQLAAECSNLRDALKRSAISAMPVFQANNVKLGKLPDDLRSAFNEVALTWKKLGIFIDEFAVDRCKSNPKLANNYAQSAPHDVVFRASMLAYAMNDVNYARLLSKQKKEELKSTGEPLAAPYSPR